MADVVTLNGKTVDLSKALPWTLGDWETAEAKCGVNPMNWKKGEAVSVKDMISIVYAVSLKANPEITREDVTALEGFDHPAIDAVLAIINAKRADPKSSTSSTSSDEPTAGTSPT